MKKAKVILTSLVVLAVVGGALAFKAKNPVFCLYTTAQGGVTCPKVATIETTKVGTAISWATTRGIVNCPQAVPASNCTRTFDIVID